MLWLTVTISANAFDKNLAMTVNLNETVTTSLDV